MTTPMTIEGKLPCGWKTVKPYPRVVPQPKS